MFQQSVHVKPKLVLFDVYETLLSMDIIERKVNQLLDSKRGYHLWFELLTQYCFAEALTGKFSGFNALSEDALQMVYQMLGQSVKKGHAQEVLEMLKHVPLRENAEHALSVLSDKGYRVAALTNSPKSMVVERMERTGLISYFEEVLSSEQVKNYKPAIEVYQWAARVVNLNCQDILMVSSHAWDIAGAQHSGMATAYIGSRRHLHSSLINSPQFTCETLNELSKNLEDAANTDTQD